MFCHKYLSLSVSSSIGLRNTVAIKERAEIENLDHAFDEIIVPTEEVIEIRRGRKINRERFLANIVDFGFRSAATVFEPGEFSIRGGIIDIFPISEKDPVRIDFFGDVIDGIRYFDIHSQISSKSLEKVLLTSLMELSFDESSKSTFRSNYRTLFGGVKANDQIYHSVTDGQYIQGLEHMLPLFFDRLYSIFDYFVDPLVIFEDNIHNNFREHESLIKNQFANKTRELQQIRDHQWKALVEAHPTGRALFWFLLLYLELHKVLYLFYQ